MGDHIPANSVVNGPTTGFGRRGEGPSPLRPQSPIGESDERPLRDAFGLDSLDFLRFVTGRSANSRPG